MQKWSELVQNEIIMFYIWIWNSTFDALFSDIHKAIKMPFKGNVNIFHVQSSVVHASTHGNDWN